MTQKEFYCIVCKKCFDRKDTEVFDANLSDNVCSTNCQMIYYQTSPHRKIAAILSSIERLIKIWLKID